MTTGRSTKMKHPFGNGRKVLGLILVSVGITITSMSYFHRQQFLDAALHHYSDLDYLKLTVLTNATGTNVTLASNSSLLNDRFSELLQEHIEAKGAVVQRETDLEGRVDAELKSNGHCFPYNTQTWLEAGKNKRLGNFNDSLMDDDFVSQSILNLRSLLVDNRHSHSLLQHTLCHAKSRFLSLDIPQEQLLNPTNQTIHFWGLRLVYLATHIHQHAPAMQEAQVRLKGSCQSEIESKGIGRFDYECPSAKFLVVSMGRLGLGAVMRLGAVNALIAGIASNRTVLFVNNAPVGPKFIRQPWLLASCPRRDLQCFYMPSTPCVLTQDELVNGTQLQRSEARGLFKQGELPDNLSDERVLLLDLVLRPQRTPTKFRNNIVNIIHKHLIDPLVQGKPDDPRIPLLTKAANNILVEEELNDGTYYYFGHNTKHNHALVFYAMRPNLKYARQLDYIMEKTIPKDFDPDLAFGLPIRASDKCFRESECLPFQMYMNMTAQTYAKYETELDESRRRVAAQAQTKEKLVNATIIVTSEAERIHDAQKRYQEEGLDKNLPFAFQFVKNSFDVHQGTGDPGKMSGNITSDEIMVSSISSLKVQLHARYTIGNCCSNFHLLLFDFLRDGCGAAQDQVAECMQDNEDPTYRLCCQWSKTEECLTKRNQTGY
jgi:hypothetical protein